MKRLMILLRAVGLVLVLLGLSASLPARSAEAQPPPTPCLDFVTGGGWFTPTSAGPDKATFGFVAGYKKENQSLRGELNYIDKNTGMRVKATSVDVYQAFNCTDCADRLFGGTAEVDGQPGFLYSVEVIDAGEPGNAPKGQDRFIINLSNGYHADSGGVGFQSPATGQTGIDGGNIKIHKNCAE